MANGERGGRRFEHDLVGYQVYDRHYEKIGKVDDLFVNESDQLEYIGVKMGLLGTKSTLIPVEIVRVNDRRQLIEVAADKDAVKEGPVFGDDREITSRFERQVLAYYGVETEQPFAERGAYGAYYPDATGDERVDLRPGERAAEQHSAYQPAEPYERSGERGFGVDHERGRDREHSSERGFDEVTGGVDRERGRDLEGEDEVRVQRSEEELIAGTRERQAGGVNVRKRVRTEREQARVPKQREDVHIERVPVEERGASKTAGTAREMSEDETGEEYIRIPIIEEEVVVEKRPVVKEEIRIRKSVVEDEELVEADVRKEEVDIDDQTPRRSG